MRKSLIAMGLTGLVLAVTAGEASAQRRLMGGARAVRDQTIGRVFYNNPIAQPNGFNSGFQRFDNGMTFARDQTVGRVFYNNGFTGNNTYNSYVPGYFNGYRGNENGYSGAFPLGNNAGFRNSSYPNNGTYYSNDSMVAPSYNGTTIQPGSTIVMPGNTIAMPATSGSGIIQTNYGSNDTSATTAKVKVILPTSEARVFLNDSSTISTGMERTFESPTLVAGTTYTYTVKATWNADGRIMEKFRELDVRAGGNYTVNFADGSTR